MCMACRQTCWVRWASPLAAEEAKAGEEPWLQELVTFLVAEIVSMHDIMHY